jgi:hypothetical protein
MPVEVTNTLLKSESLMLGADGGPHGRKAQVPQFVSRGQSIVASVGEMLGGGRQEVLAMGRRRAGEDVFLIVVVGPGEWGFKIDQSAPVYCVITSEAQQVTWFAD